MPAKGQFGKLTSVAYKIACPMCNADVGDRCLLVKTFKRNGPRNPGHLAYSPHPQRREAARAARAGQTVRARGTKKRCPRCKKRRRFRGHKPSDRRHGKAWTLVGDVLVCPVCIPTE